MNLLILGGTAFVGRHIAEQALDAGHRVTLFHRGRTNPELFPQAEHVLGDRVTDIERLDGATWDAVIDTSGYEPEIVGASARFLATRAPRYVFISTISVYQDPVAPGVNEQGQLARLAPDADRALSGATYGALKVECEEVVADVFGAHALIIRPGLIVGPYDPTDRFTYWPVRISQGGEVLAPWPDSAVQWIDARDLAQWTLALLEGDGAGVFNATGPAEPATLHQVLATCRARLAPDAEFVRVDGEFLLEQDVRPFADLPMWLPPALEGLMQIDCAKAIAAGLRFRSLEETVAGTLAWRPATPAERPLAAGLSPARESELLTAWRARSGDKL